MTDSSFGPAGVPVAEVHVVPVSRTAKWRVHEGDASVPLSEHASETDAEFAARGRAKECGATCVVIHDRYHRTRETAVSTGRARDP